MCRAQPVKFALCGTMKWNYDYCHQATVNNKTQSRVYCADTKFEPSSPIQTRDTPCDNPRCTICLPRPVMEISTEARGPDIQVPTLFIRDLAAGRVQRCPAGRNNRSADATIQKRKATEPVLPGEAQWKLPPLKLNTPARVYLPIPQLRPNEKRQNTSRQSPFSHQPWDDAQQQQPETAQLQAVEAEAQSLNRIRIAGRWKNYCEWRERTQAIGHMAYWDERRLLDGVKEREGLTKTKQEGDEVDSARPELLAKEKLSPAVT